MKNCVQTTKTIPPFVYSREASRSRQFHSRFRGSHVSGPSMSLATIGHAGSEPRAGLMQEPVAIAVAMGIDAISSRFTLSLFSFGLRFGVRWPLKGRELREPRAAPARRSPLLAQQDGDKSDTDRTRTTTRVSAERSHDRVSSGRFIRRRRNCGVASSDCESVRHHR